jgi:putative nucleotidyltransferase with HDIG domain
MARQFKLIKDSIIPQGISTTFDFYIANETKTSMNLFIEKGEFIDSFLKNKLDDAHAKFGLFIRDDDFDAYELFFRKSLYILANTDSVPEHIKATIIYDKSVEIVSELFSGEHTLDSVQELQPVVSSIISLITHDHNSIDALLKITAYDYSTYTHSINVGIYSIALGSLLGLSSEDLELLGTAAVLHDIGKSVVNSAIINKDGILTPSEYEIAKTHAKHGAAVAQSLGVENRKILDGIMFHHEKLDGTGYPSGIAGNDIPQFAKIIAVAEVFDALTTNRSYKSALNSFEAIQLMKTLRAQLDINIIYLLIKLLQKN